MTVFFGLLLDFNREHNLKTKLKPVRDACLLLVF